MKSALETTIRPLITLTILYTCSIHINKYILSVLGFTYPTVFQGWQTLVAVIIMRVLVYSDLTPTSWNSFRAYLPLFLCYVGAIVAGSKALSGLPVPVVICVSNVILGSKHTIRTLHSEARNYFVLGASFLCVISAVYIFYADPVLSELGISSLWMLLHVFFVGAQLITVGDKTSSTFNSFDKLFYSNLFSVVVLAPSSFYLEEAFEALHFQERRQTRFVVGCIFSGVFGALVSIFQIRNASAPLNILPLARAVCCLLSPMILPCSFSFPIWMSIVVNVITSCFIASNIFGDKPDNIRQKVEQV